MINLTMSNNMEEKQGNFIDSVVMHVIKSEDYSNETTAIYPNLYNLFSHLVVDPIFEASKISHLINSLYFRSRIIRVSRSSSP